MYWQLHNHFILRYINLVLNSKRFEIMWKIFLTPEHWNTLIRIFIIVFVFLYFLALPEFIAVGVQIYVNMNIKELAEAVPGHVQNPSKLQYHATFITPWDTTIIGKLWIVIKTNYQKELTCTICFRKIPTRLVSQ